MWAEDGCPKGGPHALIPLGAHAVAMEYLFSLWLSQ